MFVFRAGNILEFSYENYKGVVSRRRVRLMGLDYGSNEWYPDDQWFARCYDLNKGAVRSFALAKIDAREVTVTVDVVPYVPEEMSR